MNVVSQSQLVKAKGMVLKEGKQRKTKEYQKKGGGKGNVSS